jgi:hypothetical protein
VAKFKGVVRSIAGLGVSTRSYGYTDPREAQIAKGLGIAYKDVAWEFAPDAEKWAFAPEYHPRQAATYGIQCQATGGKAWLLVGVRPMSGSDTQIRYVGRGVCKVHLGLGTVPDPRDEIPLEEIWDKDSGLLKL